LGAWSSGSLLVVAVALADVAAQTPSVPGDTILRVQIVTPVSSRTATLNDVVETTLVEALPPDRGLPPSQRTNAGPRLPAGARVVGRVDQVRAADRAQRRTAQLLLRFSVVQVDASTTLTTNAEILIAGRGFLVDRGVVRTDPVSRSTWEEPFILGVPLGAGLGLLSGRQGKFAAIGAAIGFSVIYVPPLVHTSGDPFRDVVFPRGYMLVLQTR